MTMNEGKKQKNIPFMPGRMEDYAASADFDLDVIPAFLTPEHINNNQDITKPSQRPVVDIDFDETQPANHGVSDFVIREKLHNAIAHDKMDVFLQPIVSLPARKHEFYELFGRLRAKPGIYLGAREYMPLASEERIITDLDTLLLANCLKIMRHHQEKHHINVGYFININPFTLRNRLFMNRLLGVLKNNKYIAQNLIFELHYADMMTLSPMEQKIIDGLVQIGCRISVDNIGGIPTDIKYLNARHISFVKIDAKDILSKGETETGFSQILTKKHNLNVNGIDIIIEKVETEKQVISLLDYDFKYGQGFLFGRPDFRSVYNGGS